MARKCLISIVAPILFFSVFVLPALAQVRDTDISLVISPRSPAVNQNVTATLSSHVTNLDRASISWNLNDKDVLNGIGKKALSFQMTAAGANITATINTLDGQSLQKKITLSSGGVDLLWQAADAYAPPFYRGKTLTGRQGEFKVVAIPSLASPAGEISPHNLSYAWSKDSSPQVTASGWGKSYFIFPTSPLDKTVPVGVKVSDITGSISASASATLGAYSPMILLYEDDPALGVRWERALSDGFRISQAGATIVAEPYFFSPVNLNSLDLVFRWFVNGRQISTPSPKNILSVKPETSSGNAEIRLEVENSKLLFQDAKRGINVGF